MKLRLPWMSRADRRRWSAAGSVADLGELTALWLEGAIASQPGYQPNYGPDPETMPLVPTLAACNRGGYLTDASQPGTDPEVGFDGRTWDQRAAVEGYVRDAVVFARLVGAAEAAGLEIVITDAFDTKEAGTVVTRVEGEPYTRFGAFMDYRDVQNAWPGIGRGALDDVLAATRLTLAAPEYGAAAGAVLWDFLDGFFFDSRAAAAS